MLFNSLPFLIFLPVVVILYYLLAHRWRWMLLLAASYFFYGYWKVEYLALIAASTLIDFFAARYIASSDSAIKRRIGLGVSLAANLGMLFFFKYSSWFMEDVLYHLSLIDEPALNHFKTLWTFALPVGISFYTFQTMGYTIDVYYNKAQPEKNPFRFALFVSYFPQLVAGPIERFSSLHPQLFTFQRFQYRNLQLGGRLILYGLFIKMCVADNISPVADQIFEQAPHASRWQLITGMLLFGVQIYSDFHGYSLIAIGAARLMGVQLMDNFRAPYTATSIREFWSRWHISLSTWFRDYLYLPLGGSREGRSRLALNIMVVFLLSGLWHGANWTFVAWGALHGVIYLAERFVIPSPVRKTALFTRWLLTMFIVFVAWVFFRSASLADALAFIRGMFAPTGEGINIEWNTMIISFAGLFLLADVYFRDSGPMQWLDRKSTPVRWTIYAFLVYSITAFAGTVNHPFIYFQF